jgi:hypothetical protein
METIVPILTQPSDKNFSNICLELEDVCSEITDFFKVLPKEEKKETKFGEDGIVKIEKDEEDNIPPLEPILKKQKLECSVLLTIAFSWC